MSASVEINSAVCDKLIATLEDEADKVVRKFAFKIQAESQMAARDTGLRKLLLKQVKAAHTRAQQQQKRKMARIVRHISVEKGEAIIAYPMEYAIYVEMGTSKMPARSFLTSAAESNNEPFSQALKDLVK